MIVGIIYIIFGYLLYVIFDSVKPFIYGINLFIDLNNRGEFGKYHIINQFGFPFNCKINSILTSSTDFISIVFLYCLCGHL